MRFRRVCLTACILWAAAGSMDAAGTLILLSAGDRTTLALKGAVPRAGGQVVQVDSHTVVLRGSMQRCTPARATAGSGASLLQSVTLDCGSDGTFTATIVTNAAISASTRTTPGHLYVDLMPATAGRTSGQFARNVTPPPAAAGRSAVLSRARRLAEAGNVKDLLLLIQENPFTQDDDAFTSLLDLARERRLEHDRRLFAAQPQR